MNFEMLSGFLMPLFGTALGAALVFVIKDRLSAKTQGGFYGFAAGVMTAASIWSLLLPAMEQEASQSDGLLQLVPVLGGLWIGVAFLWMLDAFVPHLHPGTKQSEGRPSGLGASIKMMLAVALHNIPEGMAVGVVMAAGSTHSASVSLMAALSLSLGIALQNVPEGAMISLPLRQAGFSKSRAFWYGTLSGAVEPLAALLAWQASVHVVPYLGWILSFAAGAMLYVVVEELIPSMSRAARHSNAPALWFMIGFSLMLVMDVLFG